MKNRKGYLLLEGVVCLFVIVTISLSLYSFLYFVMNIKNQQKIKSNYMSKEKRCIIKLIEL